MPMDFDRLLQHPIPSPNYRPKPNSNRPNLVPQGSGLPTEALTPGLAALVERRQERHDPVIHELAPHLLLADPSRSQNRHLNLHVHRAPEQTSFHVAGRSNHPPSVSSATEDYSDADQAAESRSGDESSTSKNVTNSQRSGRFASPVDLTCGNPATPSNISHHNPRRKRSNESMPESGPSNHSKRRRTSGTLHKQPGGLDRTRTIEEVDLVNDDDDTLSRALQNQRAEQVQSQQGPAGSKTVKLGNLTCTVCLDTPKDLTVTSCGHAFCRDCLFDWLSTGEKQHPKRSNCPACRKTISRTKKLDVIPLEIMLKTKKTSRRLSSHDSLSPAAKRRA